MVRCDYRGSGPVFERPGDRIPLSVRLGIGRMIQDDAPVPAEWMLSWLMTHPESHVRTPAMRAFPEFKALFEIRFRERFPNGLRLKCPKPTLCVHYHNRDVTSRVAEVPGISHLSEPLRKAASIAESVTQELAETPVSNMLVRQSPAEHETLDGVSIALDRERIATIMADTNYVSDALHAAFSGDADDRAEDRIREAKNAAGFHGRLAGLDARHQGLVEQLVRHTSWTPAEFKRLAQEFGLMPSGALETINEWAFDHYGDSLILGDETFDVNTGILPT